jgi:hypothetical protein
MAPVVWLTFRRAMGDVRTDDFSFAHCAFSSLEKAMKTHPNDDKNTYFHAPYRVHGCGAKDTVYVYDHGNANVTVTNIAEDLRSLARAMPNHYNKYGGSGFDSRDFGLDIVDICAYKLDIDV